MVKFTSTETKKNIIMTKNFKVFVSVNRIYQFNFGEVELLFTKHNSDEWKYENDKNDDDDDYNCRFS